MATQKKRSRFRLYVLGRLDDKASSPELTTFAEFETGRALRRLRVNKSALASVTKKIVDLRGFLEANYPADYSEASLQEFGAELFDLLIQGDVKDLFAFARGRSDGLTPFEIFLEDYRIASWPWEYLYDRKHFLCQEFYPICRGIFTLDSRKPVAARKGKVRLLLVVGVAPTDPEASPEEQIKWIEEVLKGPLAEGSVELKVMRATSPEQVQRELQNNRYDILHFFGHAAYDPKRKQGYLKFHRPGQKPATLYAVDFANLLIEQKIRLVFLNACETARGGETEDPARSSVAAALLERGIPAVIAAQFSMPDVNAHYLASMIYDSLVAGAPLIDALRNGRLAMGYANNAKFCDWGIPVLYSFDPDLVIFKGTKQRWVSQFQGALQSENVLKAMARESAPEDPSVFAAGTTKYRHEGHPNVTVALMDIDSKVGFLPEIVHKANAAQKYFHFKVAYAPIPGGSFRDRKGAEKTFVLERVQDYLKELTGDLKADRVCCLTECMVDDGEEADLFASEVKENPNVSVISTFDLRRYSREANVPFAKSVLFLCLAMLIVNQPGLEFHDETAGCLLDYCYERDDIVVGLKRMKFDHEFCREQIKDAGLLRAIDALLALEV
jgi:hypothetical protein